MMTRNIHYVGRDHRGKKIYVVIHRSHRAYGVYEGRWLVMYGDLPYSYFF